MGADAIHKQMGIFAEFLTEQTRSYWCAQERRYLSSGEKWKCLEEGTRSPEPRQMVQAGGGRAVPAPVPQNPSPDTAPSLAEELLQALVTLS